MSPWIALSVFAWPLLLACVMGTRLGRRYAGSLLFCAPIPGLLAAFWCLDTGPVRVGPWIFELDPPGAMLLGAASMLWMAAGVFAVTSLRGTGSEGRFYDYWLLTMAGSLGVFLAADLFGFLTLFALASLPATGLVAHEGTPKSLRATKIYMACALTGEGFLLAGMVLLAVSFGGATIPIAEAVHAISGQPWGGLALGLLVCGFGMKMGLVPAHFWLPLAHPAAPAAASAVLSGAIIKAGVIGLVRFLPFESGPLGPWAMVLAWGGLVTALWGVVAGLSQKDPKTILAYSSVSQMGVVAAMLGLGCLAESDTISGEAAFYAMHHLFAKGALFLAVGVAAASGGCRPWLIFLPCAVLALGMAGLPFTGGALAKMAAKSVMGAGLAGFFASVSAAGTAMLMLHFLNRLRRVYNGKPKKIPSGLPGAFLVLALAGTLVRWGVFRHAGFGESGDLFEWSSVFYAALPVGVGCGIYWLLRNRWEAFSGLPPGDVFYLLKRVCGPARAAGLQLMRFELGLRDSCTAGVFLVGTVVGLWFLFFA